MPYESLKEEVKLLEAKLEVAIKAMKAVSIHLNTSSYMKVTPAIYRTPAQEMRIAADEMEARDAAISEFKRALETLI